MTATARFQEIARGFAHLRGGLTQKPPVSSAAPCAPAPQAGAAAAGGARHRTTGRTSRPLRPDYVRVLSEASVADIGATPADRAAAVRADLAAAALAKRRGDEAREADQIQAEFGFDQLEPMPANLREVPDHLWHEPPAGAPLPYYLRD